MLCSCFSSGTLNVLETGSWVKALKEGWVTSLADSSSGNAALAASAASVGAGGGYGTENSGATTLRANAAGGSSANGSITPMVVSEEVSVSGSSAGAATINGGGR